MSGEFNEATQQAAVKRADAANRALFEAGVTFERQRVIRYLKGRANSLPPDWQAMVADLVQDFRDELHRRPL